MKTKLFLFIFIAILSISSKDSFAKTRGHYVSLDAVLSRSTSYFDYGDGSGNTQKAYKGDGLGAGIGYDYAFGCDCSNFFTAVGVFAEFNNVDGNKFRPGHGGFLNDFSSVDIHSRQGIKLTSGYDFNDKIAFFVNGGISRSDIEYSFFIPQSGHTIKSRNYQTGYFYGSGLTYSFNEKSSIKLEYNYQQIFFKLPMDSQNIIAAGDEINNRLHVVKIGYVYKF